MLSDIEIAQKAEMKPITEIGESIGIPATELENYGHYKAKVSLKFTRELEEKPNGKLILVTAISPTPAAFRPPSPPKCLSRLARRRGPIPAISSSRLVVRAFCRLPR